MLSSLSTKLIWCYFCSIFAVKIRWTSLRSSLCCRQVFSQCKKSTQKSSSSKIKSLQMRLSYPWWIYLVINLKLAYLSSLVKSELKIRLRTRKPCLAEKPTFQSLWWLRRADSAANLGVSWKLVKCRVSLKLPKFRLPNQDRMQTVAPNARVETIMAQQN